MVRPGYSVATWVADGKEIFFGQHLDDIFFLAAALIGMSMAIMLRHRDNPPRVRYSWEGEPDGASEGDEQGDDEDRESTDGDTGLASLLLLWGDGETTHWDWGKRFSTEEEVFAFSPLAQGVMPASL